MSALFNTEGVRPLSAVTKCGRCRSFYVDDSEGRRAHNVVFGHHPAPKGAEP